MQVKEVLFIERAPSPHTQPLYSALAATNRWTVSVASFESLSPERRALGWSDEPSSSYSRLSICGTRGDALQRLVREPSVLVLNSPRFAHDRAVRNLLKGTSCSVWLMSEPRVGEGVAGSARLLHSICSEAILRDRARVVLAIGAHGPAWFVRARYGRSRIIPWAYFIDDTANVVVGGGAALRRAGIRIGFAGRIIPQKGVRHLVEAMKGLPARFHLEIVGGGGDLENVRRAAAPLGTRCRFLGALSMAKCRSWMSTVDILVLPSLTTDDGWGVVVSEALFAGAAVVVSDKVGSSILTSRLSGLGLTVESGSSRNIAEACAHLAESGALAQSAREHRARWTRAALSATAGAAYFTALAEASTPTYGVSAPPWEASVLSSRA